MIIQSICLSFKNELPLGLHNFANPAGNVFKMALFTDAANLNQNTTFYDPTGEVSGSGYVAGGATLSSITPVLSAGVVVFDFADVTWNPATFTARGALIYNATSSNRAVMVLDFGSDRTASGGAFTVR